MHAQHTNVMEDPKNFPFRIATVKKIYSQTTTKKNIPSQN